MVIPSEYPVMDSFTFCFVPMDCLDVFLIWSHEYFEEKKEGEHPLCEGIVTQPSATNISVVSEELPDLYLITRCIDRVVISDDFYGVWEERNLVPSP